jgi:hypothetical protein
LDPAGRFTAIIEATSRANHAVGQMLHRPNDRAANLTFLLMDDPGQMEDLPALIEFLSYHTCETGAFNLRVQLEEKHPLSEVLRRCSFSVYGVQTIWKLPATKEDPLSSSLWRQAVPTDETHMRSLYQSLTPPVEQAAEPFQTNGEDRLVFSRNSEISVWAEYRDGPKGLYLSPVIPPTTQDPVEILKSLTNLVSLVSKPAFIQIRSHQFWLQSALEEIGSQPVGRYTLLVKHLAIGQKALASNAIRSRAEQAQPKPTVPIIQNLTADCAPVKSKETG